MFRCPFTDITTPRTPDLSTRAHRLQAFSRACEQNGLHPAQGLRLVHNTQQLVNRGTYAIADMAPAAQVQQLTSNLTTQVNTIISAPQLCPEHFLLTTQLTSPAAQQGYVSPVLDVPADIAFIRTQRRFNKRRYSRVRVSSRPSF